MTTTQTAEQRVAQLSADGRYRYRLDRWWGDGQRLVWVMLNPSTADASEDDPTIRRVRGFTKREGYDGLTVVNLFALRATNPAALMRDPDPLGEDIGLYFGRATRDADVIVAWGANPAKDRYLRAYRAACDLAVDARSLRCLGTTKDGHPRHPLYVKADAELVPYVDRSVTSHEATP